MLRSLAVLSSLAGALLLAGCVTPAADQGAAPAQSAAPTVDARDAVTVVKESFQRSFDTKTLIMTARITAGPQQGLDVTARVDLTAGAMQMTMKGVQDGEMVKLGDEIFFRSGKAGEEPYVRLEIDKLKATSPLRNSLDVTAYSGILGGLVTAEKRDGAAGSVTYEGVADLNKAVEAAPASGRSQLEQASRLAKSPSAVPYTAIVDSEGRMTDFTYTVDTTFGRMATEIRLTELGKPVTVTRPAPGDVEEASASDYAIF